jgi:2-methylisocitrate lyase-like PEP mutase family enzyme
MTTREETFERFRALHERPGAFVIPNPWDAGSARVLAALGFEALATTSSGLAFALGRHDLSAELTRDDVLANAVAIVEATDLPVSADLQDGFGADPEACAETIRQAAAVGLVGGSIEDGTADPARPVHEFDLAVARVAAAAEAVRGRAFLLTARAENFIVGRPDLDDTIRRLRAFAEAGADVLYAPGLTRLDDIRAVCAAVPKPVNVLMGLPGVGLSVADLAAAGVKRISVGGAFARAATAAFVAAAHEVRERGTFSFTETNISGAEIDRLLDAGKASRADQTG